MESELSGCVKRYLMLAAGAVSLVAVITTAAPEHPPSASTDQQKEVRLKVLCSTHGWISACVPSTDVTSYLRAHKDLHPNEGISWGSLHPCS